jgi:hypothetical protein
LAVAVRVELLKGGQNLVQRFVFGEGRDSLCVVRVRRRIVVARLERHGADAEKTKQHVESESKPILATWIGQEAVVSDCRGAQVLNH